MDNINIENKVIPDYLENIEKDYNIKILLAVESGSRAWGFESENSDWDVRFIYVHQPEWYFKVEEQRDVIEHMFPNDIDLAGWELRKALQLLRRSNPSLLEWFHSPKVYYVDKDFEKRILAVERDFFNPVKSMYHYNRIYNKHNDRYLNKEEAHMKRFLYFLRGVYACKWIEEKQSIPLVNFLELVDNLETNEKIKQQIYNLIEIKKSGKECDMIVVDKDLMDYAQHWANHYNETIGQFRPEQNKIATGELDKILFEMVHLKV